jgi:hypothetical protein
MAVSAADLVHPLGLLPVEWFPTADLDVWIAAGGATAPETATPGQVDGITTAFVYWRAHEAKGRAILGSPDSVSLDDLSRTTSNGRSDRLFKLAQQFRDAHALLVEAAQPVEPVPGVAPPRPSRSIEMVRGF